MNEATTSSFQGLTENEVQARRSREGFNELPSRQKRGIWIILFEVIREPMFLLLVACGLLYLLLGDPGESLLLLGFVLVIIGITVFQERKTERALDALRDLSSPRALVIRGGQEYRIAGREVVRDDIIIIKEGDRIPADAILLKQSNILVDESLLTGESFPVGKTICTEIPQDITPGGENQPLLYSGTMLVQGSGIAKVIATGVRSELGKIGKSLSSIEQESTLLQKETRQIVTTIALLGALLFTIVVTVYGFTRGDWIHGFLAGLTLAMAMLPEEFPVVLTIFLALGAWRISRRSVLTRRFPAIETLGAATVLCVDKTGTLTMNRMAIQQIYSSGALFRVPDSATDFASRSIDTQTLPEQYHEIVEYALLASQQDPFDPMERAIHSLAKSALARTEHIHGDWSLVQEYPLSRDLLAVSQVWKSPDNSQFMIAAKGAPEAIFDLCHMSAKDQRQNILLVESMAREGLRLIAVAHAIFSAGELPHNQHDFEFQFLGILGFADPVRPGVAPAVEECYRAGMRMIMITGDYPGTALKIAKEIGMPGATEKSVITGPDLRSMNDLELQNRIRYTSIFARVVPEQKLRIVNALKAKGEVVAMTGDGVNDAPALKAAHIGVAMGGRGTDVARESASIVLLNDDFLSIVGAVRMGRRIYDNLQKAMAYIVAVHVPIAGLSMIPVLFKMPLLLLPVHVVFMELVIDPACSVVFEAEEEEKNTMNRPPRSIHSRIFGKERMFLSLFQGLSVLAITLAIYTFSNLMNFPEGHTRALTFSALLLSNLALILTNRSWNTGFVTMMRTRNRAFYLVSTGATLFLLLVLYVPLLRGLFKFDFLSFQDLVIASGSAFLGVAWFEAFKWFRKLKTKSPDK